MLFQNTAHPDVGRQLVFRNANALALEVLGAVDTAIRADIDRGMPKSAAEEHGHGHIMRVSACDRNRIRGQRELGDIESLVPERTEEHLFRREQHWHGVNAVDLDSPVNDAPCAVIVPHGKGEFQIGHMDLL